MQQTTSDLQEALRRALAERDRALLALDEEKTSQPKLLSQLREREASYKTQLAALQKKVDEKDAALSATNSEIGFLKAVKREEADVVEQELKKGLKAQVRQIEELAESKRNVEALIAETKLAREAQVLAEQEKVLLNFFLN